MSLRGMSRGDPRAAFVRKPPGRSFAGNSRPGAPRHDGFRRPDAPRRGSFKGPRSATPTAIAVSSAIVDRSNSSRRSRHRKTTEAEARTLKQGRTPVLSDAPPVVPSPATRPTTREKSVAATLGS